jgi:hypothetical protein
VKFQTKVDSIQLNFGRSSGHFPLSADKFVRQIELINKRK